MLVGGEVPAFGYFPVFKFPKYAPMMIKIIPVFPIRPDMLALQDVIIIHSDNQLFDFDIRFSHHAAHGVEESNDFVHAGFRPALRIPSGKCPFNFFKQNCPDSFHVAFTIRLKEFVYDVEIRVIVGHNCDLGP